MACVLASLSGCARHVHIAMYGDSTTWGNMLVHGQYVQSPTNQPAVLQRMFKDAHYSVIVENHGILGATCMDFLRGQINGASIPWEKEMKQSDADIVVMNIGINDVMRKTQSRVAECYRKLAAITKAHGKLFVIETPNPVTLSWGDQVGDVAKEARDSGFIVIDQWSAIQRIPLWNEMLPDGIHPNDTLYRYKAIIAFPLLSKLATTLSTSANKCHAKS